MANAFPFKSDCPVPSIDAITGSLVASCLVSSPPDPIFEFPNDFPVPPPPGFNFGCYEPSVRVRFQSATISTDPETSEQVILSQPSFGVNVLYPNRDETGLCQPVFEFLVRFPGIICYAPSTSVFLTQSTSYVDPSTGIIVIDSSPSFGVKITYPNFSETGVCEPTFNFLVRFPPAVCPEVSTDAQFTFNREYLDPLISLEGSKREGEEDKCAFDFNFSLDLPCASIEVMPSMSIAFAPDERITYGLPYGSVSVSLLPSEPAEEGGKGPDVCKYKFDFFLNMPQQHPKYAITGEIPCYPNSVDMNSCMLEASGSAFSWTYHSEGFSGGGIRRHPELDPTANADKNDGLPVNYKQRLWPPEELVWYPVVTGMDLTYIPASEVSWGFVEGTPAGCLQQPAEGYFLEYNVAWFRHPKLDTLLSCQNPSHAGCHGGESFEVLTCGSVWSPLTFLTLYGNAEVEDPDGCYEAGYGVSADSTIVAGYTNYILDAPNCRVIAIEDCPEDQRTAPCWDFAYIGAINLEKWGNIPPEGEGCVTEFQEDFAHFGPQEYVLTYELYCDAMPHVFSKYAESEEPMQLEHGDIFWAITDVEVKIDNDDAEKSCDYSTNYKVDVFKRYYRLPEDGSGSGSGIDFTPELAGDVGQPSSSCCDETPIKYIESLGAFSLVDKEGGGHYLRLQYVYNTLRLPKTSQGYELSENETVNCAERSGEYSSPGAWVFEALTEIYVVKDYTCEPCGTLINTKMTKFFLTWPEPGANVNSEKEKLYPCDQSGTGYLRKVDVMRADDFSLKLNEPSKCGYHLEFKKVELVLPVLAKDVLTGNTTSDTIECVSGSWTFSFIDAIEVKDYNEGDCAGTGSRQLSVDTAAVSLTWPDPGASNRYIDEEVVNSCSEILDVVTGGTTPEADLKLELPDSKCGYRIKYNTRRIMLPTVKFIENTLPTPPNAGELAVISEIKMEANSDCSSNPLAKQLEVTWGVTDFGGYTGDVVIVCCVECPDEDLIVKCRKLTFAKGILMSRSEACDDGECTTSGGDCP